MKTVLDEWSKETNPMAYSDFLFKQNEDLRKQIERLQEQIKKLQYYRERAHQALCEISSLSEKEMDGGNAWDIAHNAILCLNEISGV